MLLCLVQCQLTLVPMTIALLTLHAMLALEPASAQMMQMQTHALELEVHMHNLDVAVSRGAWVMVHVVLDWCLQVVEAEGTRS